MSRQNLWRVVLLFWSACPDFVTGLGECYFPPETQGQLGFLATEQKPCDAFADVALCCPLGWTCFSNKLCVVTDSSAVGGIWPLGTTLRGTCTNPLWDDTACGDFCLDDPVSQNNGSVEYCTGDSWCCGPAVASGSCDCQSGKGTFEVPAGEAQTIIGVTGLESTSTFFTPASTSLILATETTSSQDSTSAQVSTSTTSGFVISTSTSESSSFTSSVSSSSLKSNGISSTSNTSGSSTSRPTSTSSSTSTSGTTGVQKSLSVPTTQKTSFKVGIGVASVAAAIAGIIAIILFIMRRRRNKRLANLFNRNNDSDISFPQTYTGPPLAGPQDPYAIAIPPRSPVRLDRGSNPQMRSWLSVNRSKTSTPRPLRDHYSMPYDGT